MTDAVSDISGIFTVNKQTWGKRVACIFAISLGLGLFPLGWYIKDAMGWMVMYVLFFFGGLLVLAGLANLFGKRGVYFEGVRTTESGFEAGTLTAHSLSIEPQSLWGYSLTGRILEGKWESRGQIGAPTLSVLVFLKESTESKSRYFFDRVVITSQDSILHEVTGIHHYSELWKGNLVGMLNGQFELLGGKYAMPCNTHLPSLERIANVISTSGPANPPLCTLTFVAKTVHVPGAVAFGLVGGLIAGGIAARIDSKNRGKLQEAFKEGRLFDADCTQKLIGFTEKHGWTITTGLS